MGPAPVLEVSQPDSDCFDTGRGYFSADPCLLLHDYSSRGVLLQDYTCGIDAASVLTWLLHFGEMLSCMIHEGA